MVSPARQCHECGQDRFVADARNDCVACMMRRRVMGALSDWAHGTRTRRFTLEPQLDLFDDAAYQEVADGSA